jgi:imidazoleglycerol-phosphate dehydratase
MTTPSSVPARVADVQRNTSETQIRVHVNLDGSGRAQLSTGIGFFDHMLDQIARHGLIDLEIDAKGDLHIDGHHTVEDVGITLGQAFAKAVGDKKGIRRYGHAYVPLDEALSRVVIDFSGRPGLHMRVPFKAGMVGGFDTQLTYEFFQGFVNHAGRCTSTTCTARMPTTRLRPCSRPLRAHCAWRWSATSAWVTRFPRPKVRSESFLFRVPMKSKTVAVVDYGSGNLRSVSQAVVHAAVGSGVEVIVTSPFSASVSACRCCWIAAKRGRPKGWAWCLARW